VARGFASTYVRERTKRVQARQRARGRVAEASGQRGITVGGRRRRKGAKGRGRQGGRTSGETMPMDEGPDLLLWGSLALGAFLLFKK